MAVTKKRTESQSLIDNDIQDMMSKLDESKVNTGPAEPRQDILDRLEAEESESDESDSVVADDESNSDGSDDNDSANRSEAIGDDGEPSGEKPQTVEDFLDALGAKSSAKLQETIEKDNSSINDSFIVGNLYQNATKDTHGQQYPHYKEMCIISMVIGLVFIIVSAATSLKYPIPFFGGWNLGVGIFLLGWGGLMFMRVK